MKKLFTFLMAIVLFSSCRTNDLWISVQSPAPVNLSGGVKRIGILNHSIPSNDYKTLNTINQVISAETVTMITEGSNESVRGLKDALIENNRFEFITILDTIKLKSVSGVFPAPLSWDRVGTICRKNNLDALFVLEMFHTELKVIPGNVPTHIDNPMQVVNAVKSTSYSTLVKLGWRIYDPVSKTIADEFIMTKDMTYTSGESIAAKVDGLLQRKEYVKQTANMAGRIYSDRVIPHWYRVTREYYIRGGSPSFRTAMRMARVGHWNEAGELWKKETENPKRKAAKRACYNMGIINEINGNLDEAIKWEQKAYEYYGLRPALRYLNILKYRRNENELLKQQNQQ